MELLKKLNHKDQIEIVILNAPDSFNNVINELKKDIQVTDDENIYGEIEFAIVFISNNEEIEKYAELVLPKAVDNALIWFAYPKQSDIGYETDIADNNGWDIVEDYQFEIVRQISINNEWSALRFRLIKKSKNLNKKENIHTSINSEEKIKPKKSSSILNKKASKN
jgi:hypothetical protein